MSSGGSSAPSLYPRIVDDDEDATNISTPTRAVSENALSAPISPFYRAALEDVAYGEEDELFMLKHHEPCIVQCMPNRAILRFSIQLQALWHNLLLRHLCPLL